MKNLFILINVIVFLFAYAADLRCLGFTASSPLYTRYTYMFAHIAFFHLFMNMLSFHFMFKSVARTINQYLLFTAMLVGAFLATFGAEMPYPTIGASGAVMFLFGCFIVLNPSKSLFIYLVVLAVVNILTYYFAHTNGYIHAFATIYGMVFTSIIKLSRYEKDKRAKSLS